MPEGRARGLKPSAAVALRSARSRRPASTVGRDDGRERPADDRPIIAGVRVAPWPCGGRRGRRAGTRRGGRRGSRSRRPRRWLRGSPGTDRDGGGRRRPDRRRVARRSGLRKVPPWCRGSPDGACWHRKLANQAQPWHQPTRSTHSGRGRTGRRHDPPKPFPRTPGTARGENRRPERCRTDHLGAHALKLRCTDSTSQRQRAAPGAPPPHPRIGPPAALGARRPARLARPRHGRLSSTARRQRHRPVRSRRANRSRRGAPGRSGPASRRRERADDPDAETAQRPRAVLGTDVAGMDRRRHRRWCALRRGQALAVWLQTDHHDRRAADRAVRHGSAWRLRPSALTGPAAAGDRPLPPLTEAVDAPGQARQARARAHHRPAARHPQHRRPRRRHRFRRHLEQGRRFQPTIVLRYSTRTPRGCSTDGRPGWIARVGAADRGSSSPMG